MARSLAVVDWSKAQLRPFYMAHQNPSELFDPKIVVTPSIWWISNSININYIRMKLQFFSPFQLLQLPSLHGAVVIKGHYADWIEF